MRNHYCASPGCHGLIPVKEAFCDAHKPDERPVWRRSREAPKEVPTVVRHTGKTEKKKQKQKDAAETQRKAAEARLRAAYLEYRLKVWCERRPSEIAAEFDLDLALPKDKIAVEKQVDREEPAARKALMAEIAEMRPETLRIPRPPVATKPKKDKKKKKNKNKEEEDTKRGGRK